MRSVSREQGLHGSSALARFAGAGLLLLAAQAATFLIHVGGGHITPLEGAVVLVLFCLPGWLLLSAWRGTPAATVKSVATVALIGTPWLSIVAFYVIAAVGAVHPSSQQLTDPANWLAFSGVGVGGGLITLTRASAGTRAHRLARPVISVCSVVLIASLVLLPIVFKTDPTLS
jgi:hypothetical protein